MTAIERLTKAGLWRPLKLQGFFFYSHILLIRACHSLTQIQALDPASGAVWGACTVILSGDVHTRVGELTVKLTGNGPYGF